MSYNKLAQSILTSTVWMEADQIRICWFAIMAMADQNGEVHASIPGLANVARIPVEACRAAIEKFLSPDPDSRTKTDDGRRLEVIDGGWFVINHAKYRALASDEDRREKAAIRKRRQRESELRNDQPKNGHALSRSVTPCHAPSRSVTGGHADVTPVSTSREQKQNADADSKSETETESRSKDTHGGNPQPPGADATSPRDGSVSLIAQREGSPGDSDPADHPEHGPKTKNAPARRQSAARWVPPTLDEIHFAADKAGLPALEAMKFHSYYSANGWKVGKNPMKSWQHALGGWKARWEERNAQRTQNDHGKPARTSDERFISGRDATLRAIAAQAAAERLEPDGGEVPV